MTVPTVAFGSRIAQTVLDGLEAWCTRAGWTRSAAVELAIKRLLDELPLGPGTDEGGTRPRPTPPTVATGTPEKGPVANPDPERKVDPVERTRSRAAARIAAWNPDLKSAVEMQGGVSPAVDRLARLDLRLLLIRAWEFARSSQKAEDPRSYFRELCRSWLGERGIPDPTDPELDQLMVKISESTVVKKVLGETE